MFLITNVEVTWHLKRKKKLSYFIILKTKKDLNLDFMLCENNPPASTWSNSCWHDQKLSCGRGCWIWEKWQHVKGRTLTTGITILIIFSSVWVATFRIKTFTLSRVLNSLGNLSRTVPAISLSQVHSFDGQRRKTTSQLYSEHRHIGTGCRNPKDNTVSWLVILVSLFSFYV